MAALPEAQVDLAGASGLAGGPPGPAGTVGGGLGTGGLSPGGLGVAREITDAELVQRIREGDGAAGEALCRRYHAALSRYLQRLTRSALTAEDLHQQTWLSVLEHLDKFDGGSTAGGSTGGFKAWLFRIATNKANDLWRSRGREKKAAGGLRLVTDQEWPEAGERLKQTEQNEKLKKAIERLPESQRQVLMMRYYSGMKFVEIAAALGCPLNTALGRMHKAIQKLRETMES